jgi:hypothetical protein
MGALLLNKTKPTEPLTADSEAFVVPTRIVVDPATFEHMLELVENPPPPTPAMLALLR